MTVIGSTPQPGIYLNVPFAAYCTWPYLSKSGISDFAQSPAQWYALHTGEIDRKTSPSYTLGSAVDLLWVERGKFDRDHGWQIIPSVHPDTGKPMPRSGKVRTEYLAGLGPGVQSISQAMAAKAHAMRDALDNNDRAQRLRAGSHAQVSLVWDCPYTGLRLKGRPDLVDFDERVVPDLKSTRDIREVAFDRDASQYQYHWQLHLYTQGLAALGAGEYDAWRQWLITVRNEPVHGVACRPMPVNALELARDEVADLLFRWQWCRRTNHWPADLLSEIPIELPRWRYRYTPAWRTIG